MARGPNWKWHSLWRQSNGRCGRTSRVGCWKDFHQHLQWNKQRDLTYWSSVLSVSRFSPSWSDISSKSSMSMSPGVPDWSPINCGQVTRLSEELVNWKQINKVNDRHFTRHEGINNMGNNHCIVGSSTFSGWIFLVFYVTGPSSGPFVRPFLE